MKLTHTETQTPRTHSRLHARARTDAHAHTHTHVFTGFRARAPTHIHSRTPTPTHTKADRAHLCWRILNTPHPILPAHPEGREKKKKKSNNGQLGAGASFSDDRISTQCICNPVWNGLTHGTGVARRYDQLPNQYVPLPAEYPELSDRKI